MPSETNRIFCYALTQTLSPDFCNGRKSHIQLKQSCEAINTLLRGFCSNYSLSAELTKKGDIHFHAICYTDLNEDGMPTFEALYRNEIKSKRFKDKKTGRGCFGFTLIKDCKDPHIWIQYITKHLETTEKMLMRIAKTKIPIQVYYEFNENDYFSNGRKKPNVQVYEISEEAYSEHTIEDVASPVYNTDSIGEIINHIFDEID